MKKTLVYFLFTIVLSNSQAQTFKIDSLKNLIATQEADSSRARQLLNLSFAMGAVSTDSQLHYIFESIKLADKVNFTPVKIRGRMNAGYVLGYTGSFVKAMQLLLKATTIAQNNNDSTRVRLYHFHLGHIYKRQQDYRNAINNYLLSFPQSGSVSGQPEMNLGYVYNELGQADSALYFYNRALENQTRIKDTSFISGIFSGMGWAPAKKGDLAIARGYIHSTQEKLPVDPATFQVACVNISKYFSEINEKDSSIYFAKKALTVKGGEKYKPNLFNAASMLSSLYESINADSAYKYLRLSLVLNQEMIKQ